MMNRRRFMISTLAVGAVAAASRFSLGETASQKREDKKAPKSKGVEKLTKTDAEWKQSLTPEQYAVMREKGTERPFTSELNTIHEEGTFECAACGLPLFSSKAKFDSGTGWPSFYEPIAKENVDEETDRSLWETRTEVLCARCGGHLGHVFPDGPKPTGLRYCMNGVALKFKQQ
jgi:peptide-methionine (R)-S-oxide reductase